MSLKNAIEITVQTITRKVIELKDGTKIENRFSLVEDQFNQCIINLKEGDKYDEATKTITLADGTIIKKGTKVLYVETAETDKLGNAYTGRRFAGLPTQARAMQEANRRFSTKIDNAAKVSSINFERKLEKLVADGVEDLEAAFA